MTQPIRLSLTPPFAELILERPGKRNALNHAMWQAIPAHMDQVGSARGVKVLIIHGGAAGAFAAGQDITEFSSQYATRSGAMEAGAAISDALTAVEACVKPVIAAIDGACVGGGVSLALACDLRVASRSARFAITPARLGLVYPPKDMALLLKQVPLGTAKELLFTAQRLTADEAKARGLVERVVDGPALDAAKSLAEEIAAQSQWSTRAIKQMAEGVSRDWAPDTPEAIDLFLDGFENADHSEGYKAFLEKRAPKFPIE
ncbi:MAG: enoyl-CoA hydratase-related protein [Pseudomonadota bacterium]